MVIFVVSCFGSEFAYININSNVKDTIILLNNEQIGTTPIANYKIEAYKDYNLTAIANKTYYTNDIKKNINLTKDQLKTYQLKFEKADATIVFIGEPAELYINGKFKRYLKTSNRTVTLKADPKVNIKLINKNDDLLTIKQDITANSKTTIQYKLIKTNNDIKLYTTFIDNDMWEDRKENVLTVSDWKKANIYCHLLELGGFHDWELPTIQQMDNLYKNKEKIYNGFSKGFYWTKTMKESDNALWKYAYIKYFDTGETKYSVKEITKGNVRCVRVIKKDSIDDTM